MILSHYYKGTIIEEKGFFNSSTSELLKIVRGCSISILLNVDINKCRYETQESEETFNSLMDKINELKESSLYRKCSNYLILINSMDSEHPDYQKILEIEKFVFN
jgi:uncharacterized membrane protein YgaE (UPF0421/DUF939 family)